VESAKCLENRTVANEGVQVEITESLRSTRKFYLLGMDILWKWGGADIGKNMSIHKLLCAYINAQNEIPMWNKGYNS